MEETLEEGRRRVIAAQLPDCGGCQNIGSHNRWCRNKVGLSASIYGPMAERLESMGDTVGPNNMDLSNRLWRLSSDMRAWANSLAEQDIAHQAASPQAPDMTQND